MCSIQQKKMKNYQRARSKWGIEPIRYQTFFEQDTIIGIYFVSKM